MKLNLAVLLLAACFLLDARDRWTEAEATAWYAKQPWLVGANYIPATAINQLEMWQAESFDPARIDKELGWAEAIGMNTMRVFLHDLVWQQDPAAYTKRINQFLAITARHKIRPLFVLFDSCWDPDPKSGVQHAPKPGVHNSGWVQGPGRAALQNPAETARLEAYVEGVVAAFSRDNRILGWDLWNEPDNTNAGSYGNLEPAGKRELVQGLLAKTFDWARSADPAQPLTSGVWTGDWSSDQKLSPMAQLQLQQSDVISFHSYEVPTELERRITQLERYQRPILCTEYMARGNGSFFSGSLPIAKIHHVAMINWGLVQGKTQTNLPWDSWRNPYIGRQPSIWFHEVFETDGRPYQPEEVEFIKRMVRHK